MKKILVVVIVGFVALSGCTSTQQAATIGAVTGAAVGVLSSGSLKGAAMGAAIGGAAGALIGKVVGQPGQCRYHNGRGGTFIAPC